MGGSLHPPKKKKKKVEGQRDEKPWGNWAGELQCVRGLGRWGWESGE